MRIIIINGITGTIGNVLFESYITDPDTLVVGLSRRGVSLPRKLHHHIILKASFDSPKKLQEFSKLIYSLKPKEIIYFHCIGQFKTELDPHTLNRKIEVDNDQDGLDDEIVRDVKVYFERITKTLIKYRLPRTHLTIASIGSIVEEHNLEIFHSWTIARSHALEKIKTIINDGHSIALYNILISTLLSAKEMVARPYVFGTDTDPKYWLKPLELARRIKKEMSKKLTGYHCIKIFKRSPNFSKNRFENQKIKIRRLYELHGTKYK